MFSPVCHLREEDIIMATAAAPLRIGFVPEHFSTPIYFATKHFDLSAELLPFPSGTGHMITALRNGEIDVGIGLTEGWVAGLGHEDNKDENDGGYRLVGTYVETPLCKHDWSSCLAISHRGVNSQSSHKLTPALKAGPSPQVPVDPKSPPSTR